MGFDGHSGRRLLWFHQQQQEQRRADEAMSMNYALGNCAMRIWITTVGLARGDEHNPWPVDIY